MAVEIVAHIGDYTEEELKRMYLALRKFGDVSRFVNEIREAAQLDDKPVEEIRALAEWLESEADKLSEGGVLADTKRQRAMLEVTPGFKFKVDEFLLRILGMRELHTCLSNDPNWRISWLVCSIVYLLETGLGKGRGERPRGGERQGERDTRDTRQSSQVHMSVLVRSLVKGFL